MRPIINSRKHYVQTSRSTVGPVTALGGAMIDAVVAPASGVTEVREGALVRAIYVERWQIAEGIDGSEMFIVGKYPQGALPPTFAQSQALGTFEGKKNIFFVHQGLSGNDAVGNPIPVHKGWIKIPKSKQRFGLGDRLIVTSVNMHATDDSFICGFVTYKEFT